MEKLLNVDIYEDLDDDVIDKLYSSLIAQDIENIKEDHFKKILEIALYLLKYKGDQLQYFQEQSEVKSNGNEIDESTTDRINMENEHLRNIVDKVESEKSSLKLKIKDMNDEILSLQKRLVEITVNESDKDSDPLSELDRTEDLLQKISTKNKHLKKLIRDIESLQIQNIEQSKKIIELESIIEQMKATESDLRNNFKTSEIKNKELCNTINELNIEIKSIESNIKYLEDEREKSNSELKEFLEKLEDRAKSWRGIIDQKEQQLDSLRKKYEILSKNENLINLSANSDDQENDFQNLLQAVQERDSVINELESKIKSMTEEMILSTRLMNKLSKDREIDKKLHNDKIISTSRSIEDSLQRRCQDLADMLEKADEENILKSKLANDALKSLDAYQKGEEGLSKSLRKISHLEQKLNSRDKHIKALVMEVNSLHEISQENTILRKKLNIPEDMIISTTNLVAKQRNKDKLLERLNLKFRASEEIRLQLKIEKNDLKKEILDLRNKLKTVEMKKIKINDTESEISAEISANPVQISCAKCLENNDIFQKSEEKYSYIVEENENLRIGMHEILEKIREYDASSDHIIIDCSILQKLLHALDARSISGWYHPAMRMQNELIAVKERELALREKIQLVEKVFEKNKNKSKSLAQDGDKNTNELSSSSNSTISHHTYTKVNQNIEDEPNLRKNSFTIERHDSNDEKLTTDSEIIRDKQRSLTLENEQLNCFKVQYLTLLEQLNSSDDAFKQYCGNLIENYTELELKYKIQNKTVDFLKEDFNDILTQFKATEIKNIRIVSDLKLQLNNKNYDIQKKIQKSKKNNDENIKLENLILKEKLLSLQSEMANLVSNIFNENDLTDFKEEGSNNIIVIKDNMDIDFITFHEYQKMENIIKNLKKEYDEITIKYLQIQESKEIIEDELNLKQKLLLEITDNHIDLRHLIADLQSTSENNFLIAKLKRELNQAKQLEVKLNIKVEKLQKNNQKLEEKILLKEKEYDNIIDNIKFKENNLDIKIKFLKKYIFNLQEKYCKYTPLIKLTDFVLSYKKYLENLTVNNDNDFIKFDELINTKLISTKSSIESEDLIKLKLVKFELKSNYLEEQIKVYKNKLELLQEDYNNLKLKSIEEFEQWKTVQVLFGEDKNSEEKFDKIIQTEIIIMKNIGINTDIEKVIAVGNCESKEKSAKQNETISKENINNQIINESQQDDISKRTLNKSSNIIIPDSGQSPSSLKIVALENQLKQAMNLVSQRSLLLLQAENGLAEANGRIKEMEKVIRNLKKSFTNSDDQEINLNQKSERFETMIQSLQTLINDKDTTLNHYQNLLRTEREQHVKSCETYDKEIIILKRKQNELEDALNTKDIEILELTTICAHKHNNSIDNTQDYQIDESEMEFDGNHDNNNLDEISDEKLEEMFMDESKMLTPQSENLNDTAIKQNSNVKSIHFKEYKNREQFWENIVRAKDDEIIQLKDKLQENNRKKDLSENNEIEQLRILLEDKDKHINDLMETLTNFHDDQQKFFSETSFYSADQFNQLGSNLTRSETTNKILHTQIEALKRQLNNLSAREKQARDLANSLKNQLIKRPVVSIKSESRAKADQLQKRIQQLELDLEEAKKEIQKQKNTIEAKRAKNAIEVNLWEKQKRHQQNAEKLKSKLDEAERSLERSRSLLNVARTTINRLEREKHADEIKKTKCCRAPSCPNLSDQNSARSSSGGSILDIEAQQQRKIFALELSTKGVNAMAIELEKLQEKLTEIEARNIRFEAKNLQLQLDNDLLRQGDEHDRLQKRIKYLEDYILALKEELAKYEAKRELDQTNHQTKNPALNQQDQTILALKRIVEKLKVENKNLRDGRHSSSSRTNEKKQPSTELNRLQQLYTDALNKIATLQVELQLRNNCHEVPSKESSNNEFITEIKFLKEQLIKKTQLLEKAKILLTRAAAREKVFKDQLEIWKRKCSELQNVPVIEEISE